MKAVDNRNPVDQSRIWEKLGEHTGQITNLETAKFAIEQSFLNHKAQTDGNVQSLEVRMLAMIHDFEARIEKFLTPITEQLSGLKRFQLVMIIGGSVVAAMVSGLCFIVGWFLINHDKLEWIWQGK